ncbi:MAG: hypothetical protein ACLPM3_00220 [Terracidiphilus sp.]
MKISTTAWRAGVVIALVSGLFVLAVPGIPSGPFEYDEADYVYVATQGWFANWIDRPALNLVEFVRFGLGLGNDNHHRTELSEIIRKSGDVHFYRHWHGPLFYYWLGLIGNWTLDEHQLRLFSLLIPAVGAVLVYLGCLWVMPSSHLIAILGASLYATGYSVVGSPELAPHQLFAVVSLANLFCLAKLEASRERTWWWWSCVWAAVSFATLEVAFVNIAILLVFAWRCRSILFPCKQFWLRSLGLFLAVGVMLWPAGILKLDFLRSYIFMAYMALFRKGTWGNTTLLQTWQLRFHSEPAEWLLVAVAMIIWWFLPRRTEKYAAVPFLCYGGLMFAVMLKVNATYPHYPHYLLTFLPSLMVFAGITLGTALQSLPQRVQRAMAGTMILVVAAGTWRFIDTHLPPSSSRVDQILFTLRSRPLDGKTLLAPQDDVSVLHYYFPRVNLALYLDEGGKMRAISQGRVDAILSDKNEPFEIEYLSTNVTGALGGGGTVLSLGWSGNLATSRGGTGCGAANIYSALPGSPAIGTTCTITDAASCTVGTAVSGGYSTKCQVTWNGSSWMPAGAAAAPAYAGPGVCGTGYAWSAGNAYTAPSCVPIPVPFIGYASTTINPCTATSGNTALGSCTGTTPPNGQTVAVPGAGPTTALTAPSWAATPVQNVISSGGGGSAGSITRCYQVSKVDTIANGLAETAANTASCISTGPTVNSALQEELTTWTCDPNAYGYRVYGSQCGTGSGCTNTFLAFVQQPSALASPAICAFDDVGRANRAEPLAMPSAAATPVSQPITYTAIHIPMTPGSIEVFGMYHDIAGEILLGTDNGSGSITPVTNLLGASTVNTITGAFSINLGSQIPTAVSGTGSVVSLTLPSVANLQAGMYATVSGISGAGCSGYNQTGFEIGSVVGSTITYANGTSGGTCSFRGATFQLVLMGGMELWAYWTPSISATAAPSSPVRGLLYTTIASGGGTAGPVVAAAPQVSGSVNLEPDNAPALQTQLNAFGSAGGRLTANTAIYMIDAPVSIPDEMQFVGSGQGTLYGTGSTSPTVDAGTSLVWGGPDNMTLISMRNGERMGFVGIVLDGTNVNGGSNSPSSPASHGLTGIHLDSDSPLYSGVNRALIKDDTFVNLHVGVWGGGSHSAASANGGANGDVSMDTLSGVHFLRETSTAPIPSDFTSEGFFYNTGNAFLTQVKDQPSCIGPDRCIDFANVSADMVIDGLQGSGTWGSATYYNDSGSGAILRSIEDEPGGTSHSYWSVWTPLWSLNSGGTTLLENNTFGGYVWFQDASPVLSLANNNAKHTTSQSWLLDGNIIASAQPHLNGGPDCRTNGCNVNWKLGGLGGYFGGYINDYGSTTSSLKSSGIVVAPASGANSPTVELLATPTNAVQNYLNYLLASQKTLPNCADIFASTAAGGHVYNSTTDLMDWCGVTPGGYPSQVDVNAGLILDQVTYATLPTTCYNRQRFDCTNCKSVADGITMNTACVAAGTGSVAVCNSSNQLLCGAP